MNPRWLNYTLFIQNKSFISQTYIKKVNFALKTCILEMTALWEIEVAQSVFAKAEQRVQWRCIF